MNHDADALPASPDPRYRIVRRLGAGGFGEVLLAEDRQLSRQVALKLLHVEAEGADFRARFEREARVTSRLAHPHVVAVYDHGVTREGVAFIAYEYIPGRDLGARIRQGPLDPEAVRTLGQALGDALLAAHQVGVLHRDVKPENVLLREGSEAPVLCDFGIARTFHGETVATATGTILGTPAYMAPELLAGEVPSPASDQFALAATLLEAATGEVPYGARELSGVLEAWRGRGELPGLARVKGRIPDLAPALARALERDPAARFPGVRELAEALGLPPSASRAASTRVLEASASRQVTRALAAAPSATADRRPRRPMAWLTAGLLALVGFGWWSGGGPATSGGGVSAEDSGPRREAAAQLEGDLSRFHQMHPGPLVYVDKTEEHVLRLQDSLLDPRLVLAARRLTRSLLEWRRLGGARDGDPRLEDAFDSLTHVTMDVKRLRTLGMDSLLTPSHQGFEPLAKIEARWTEFDKTLLEMLQELRTLPGEPRVAELAFEAFLGANLSTPRLGEPSRRLHAALAREHAPQVAARLADAQLGLVTSAVRDRSAAMEPCEELAAWAERAGQVAVASSSEAEPYYSCWGPLREVEILHGLRRLCPGATAPSPAHILRRLERAPGACERPEADFGVDGASRMVTGFLSSAPGPDPAESRLREALQGLLADPQGTAEGSLEEAGARVLAAMAVVHRLHGEVPDGSGGESHTDHVRGLESALVNPRMVPALSDLLDAIILFLRKARLAGGGARPGDPAWREPLVGALGLYSHVAADIEHFKNWLTSDAIQVAQPGYALRLRRADAVHARLDARMTRFVDELVGAPGAPGPDLMLLEARLAVDLTQPRFARTAARLRERFQARPGSEAMKQLLTGYFYVLHRSTHPRNRGQRPCQQLEGWLEVAERVLAERRDLPPAILCVWPWQLLKMRARLVADCGVPDQPALARARESVRDLGEGCVLSEAVTREEARSSVEVLREALLARDAAPDLQRELAELRGLLE